MNETPTFPTQNSNSNANGATNDTAQLEISAPTANIAVAKNNENPKNSFAEPIITEKREFPAISSTRSSASTAPKSPPSVEEMKREERAAELVRIARLALRRGKREDARRDIAQVLALNPSDKDALELMGDVFVEEGEHEKAILVFRKGHALYPQHAEFEEKIAVALIDIEEMKLDKLMKKMAIDGKFSADDNADLRPGRAALLSLLVPGAGQFYLEQNERGAAYLGAAFLSLCGWALPLKSAMANAGDAIQSTHSVLAGWSGAIASMSGGTRTFFWLSMTIFSVLYIISALDAVAHIARLKAERRRALGL